MLWVSCFGGSRQHVDAVFLGCWSLLLFVVLSPRGGEEEERLQLRSLTHCFHICVFKSDLVFYLFLTGAVPPTTIHGARVQ